MLDTEMLLESIEPADNDLILILPALTIFSQVIPPFVDENIPFPVYCILNNALSLSVVIIPLSPRSTVPLLDITVILPLLSSNELVILS